MEELFFKTSRSNRMSKSEFSSVDPVHVRSKARTSANNRRVAFDVQGTVIKCWNSPETAMICLFKLKKKVT